MIFLNFYNLPYLWFYNFVIAKNNIVDNNPSDFGDMFTMPMLRIGLFSFYHMGFLNLLLRNMQLLMELNSNTQNNANIKFYNN